MLAIAGWDQGGHEGELKRLATELEIPWADARSTKLEDPQPLSRPTGEGGALATGEGSANPSSIFHLPSSKLPSVVFLGPQFGEAKAACYRNCDAFILPSFSEGLPMVILEAWAYGKPVLMTPQCNLPGGFADDIAECSP